MKKGSKVRMSLAGRRLFCKLHRCCSGLWYSDHLRKYGGSQGVVLGWSGNGISVKWDNDSRAYGYSLTSLEVIDE